MKIKTGDLARLVEGHLEGNPDIWITHPSKIEEGEPGSISFLANPKYEHHLYETKASAVLVDKHFQPKSLVNAALIRVDNVYLTIGKLMQEFNQTTNGNPGIHPSALIDESAQLGPGVSIGPQTIISSDCIIGQGSCLYGQIFIDREVVIGKNCTLYPGVKIYKGCRIGDDCIVHSNAVIGSDGFGFSPDGSGQYQKIPQLGFVEIGDRVEIGANTTIDRGSLGATRIGHGCKLDNLIQIAHNVQIGDNTVIAAQTGIAGSTKIGSNCQIGGQVGIAGHLTIADGSRIQAQSGIASSLTAPDGKWYGSPAIEYLAYLRSYAEFKSLPDLARRLKAIEDHFKASK